MSEKFTASNGVVISTGAGSQRGGVGFSHSNTLGTLVGGLSKLQLDAFREFFLRERDQELGRWRWPENPEFVVYPKEHDLYPVVHEPTGTIGKRSGCTGGDTANRAAAAFIAAHPLPKPWHGAKPGEVWALTVDGKETAFKLHGDLFRTGALWDIEQTDRHITAGRRIWPEVVES